MKGTLKDLGYRMSLEPCSLRIVESKDYSLALARTWDNVEYEQIGLYRVTTVDGKDVYVIAENCLGAISQASCDQRHNTEGSLAVRLPFIVRGWGAAVFLGEQ